MIDEDHVLDAMRYCFLAVDEHTIHPVFRQKPMIYRKFCEFMYRKTKNKRWVSALTYRGVEYPPDTPEDVIKPPKPPRYVTFNRFIELPEITKEDVNGREIHQRRDIQASAKGGVPIPGSAGTQEIDKDT